MCENLNEAANPMPEGNGKGWAVAIKALIGVAAVGDIVMSSISLGLKKADEKKHERGIAIADSIDLVLTLVDFGLSCGVGYGIYSPMDSSNKRICGSDYETIVADTSDAANKYSKIWIYKTAAALLVPTVSVIITFKGGEQEYKNFFDKIDIINSLCHGGLCCVSLIFEMIACIEALKVDEDKLTDKQKRDKSCFLCETFGFIFDDACAIVDTIISAANVKNIPVIIARECLEAAYAVSMFTEAGLISTA